MHMASDDNFDKQENLWKLILKDFYFRIELVEMALFLKINKYVYKIYKIYSLHK